MRRVLLILRSFDWVLFAVVALLIAFSIVMLYSLTLNVDKPDFATFHQQLLYAGIGLLVAIVVGVVDYRYAKGYGWVLFGAGLLLLAAVLAFGTEIRNTRGWFVLGPVTFQPVELAKLTMVIFFAKYFTEHADDLLRVRHLIVSGAGTLIAAALVMAQPDFGSALILLTTFLIIALFVNVRRLHLFFLVGGLVASIVLAWFFVLHGYQRERIRVLFQPSLDPLGIGYNVKQATVAIGAGWLYGRGLGLGTQSQLNFLPEQKTDFIFAVIAEELGFVGAVVLLTLYFLLFWRLFRIAQRSRDAFASHFTFGFAAVLFTQMVMNVGMNLGVMPVIGVPLPFVSAGGSSLLMFLIGIGLVQSIHAREALVRAPVHEESR